LRFTRTVYLWRLFW